MPYIEYEKFASQTAVNVQRVEQQPLCVPRCYRFRTVGASEGKVRGIYIRAVDRVVREKMDKGLWR